MGKKEKGQKNTMGKSINKLLQYIHTNVTMLNTSKIFAGFMIIMLNISSRFVTIKLSKSVESYLKYTFSRQILIFTIAWMGTRDIYIAFTVAIVFTIIMDVLLNEDNRFCVLPSSFTDYHTQKSESEGGDDITQNIPGMPQTSNTKKEGLQSASKKENESSSTDDSVVNEDDVERAMDVLKRAKEQNTVNTKDDFYSNYYTSPTTL